VDPAARRFIRDQLMEEVRPVRALLKALSQQPWKGSANHPLLATLQQNLRRRDVRLEAPCQIRLMGKGGKVRLCPLWRTRHETEFYAR
jgi:integrase/recombinase XerD